MSLANEDWASGKFGEDSFYTMMQQWQTLKVMYERKSEMLPEQFSEAARAKDLQSFAAEWFKMNGSFQQENQDRADASVSQWTELALAWLERIWES